MTGARGLFGKFQMYDDAAAIPFIMAGPDVPSGKVVNTPISLVDGYPTILAAVGLELGQEADSLPGRSLWDIMSAPDQRRFILSEYHAAGTRHGIFMVCDGHYKYIHYTHEAPQFFDLITDPQELTDLASSPEHQTLLREYEGHLRAILDPEAVDVQAKADQWAKIEAFGGEEAVLKRGLSNSPVPSEKPVFQHFN
jgi:choline-sulfatase